MNEIPNFILTFINSTFEFLNVNVKNLLCVGFILFYCIEVVEGFSHKYIK